MAVITWIRPSGTEISTGDSDGCIELAAREGWKLKGQEAKDEHEKALEALDTKGLVLEYLEAAGVEIDQRGGLDKIKEKALTALRGE